MRSLRNITLNNSIVFLSLIMILSLLSVEVLADNENEINNFEKKLMEKINNDDFEGALVDVNKILKIDPENINALNNKGGILIELGLNEEAVTNFDQVLIHDANNTQALNNKGIALIREEKLPESFDAFYNSLKVDPSNEIAFENIQKLTKRMSWIDETKNGYAVISIKDSQGNLVAYSKAHTIAVNLPLGYILLKEQGDLHQVKINGDERTLAVYENEATLSRTQFIGVFSADMTFGNNSLRVIEMELNGLIAKEGDTFTYEIAILLPGS